jgi:hypothetical protein
MKNQSSGPKSLESLPSRRGKVTGRKGDGMKGAVVDNLETGDRRK